MDMYPEGKNIVITTLRAGVVQSTQSYRPHERVAAIAYALASLDRGSIQGIHIEEAD